jgi:YidC/Oxa1 family membrane protein insertase
MDRNSVIGLLLIGLIMVGSTYIFKSEEPAKKSNAKDTVKTTTEAPKANLTTTNNSSVVQNQISTAKLGVFATTENNVNQSFVLENEVLKATFNAKGGTPEAITLKNYTTWDKKELVLFNKNRFEIKLPIKDLNLSNLDLTFEKTTTSNPNSLVLQAKGSDGSMVEFNWNLKPNSFLIDLKTTFNLQPNIVNSTQRNLHVNWSQAAPGKEKNRSNESDNSTVYYMLVAENEVDKLNPIGFDSLAFEGGAKWIGFKQQFFTSVLIPKSEIKPGSLISTRTPNEKDDLKRFNASLNLAFDASTSKSADFQFYFGPNHFQTLKEAGHDLQKQIPLGWGIFGWVNKYLVIPVFNWLDGYALNYGIIILLLTLIIKSILFPFQYKSYLSQAKMRVLKPEIDELNKKYENDDPMKKQQALMGLYKEAGVNPLGGCLPLLLQLPILLAMFNFFPNAIELRQKAFLWADDLSTYDSILTLPFSIPAYGDHVSLFALLMTISTIIYTMMNNQLSGANAQMPQLKWMMYLMPVIFLFVLNSYASGLNYYYFLANVITFGQQFAFTKFVDEKKIHAKIQANKNKPGAKKQSSFQQKLEEMARKRGYQQPGK